MYDSEVTLRDTTDNDLELMLAWRSNPTIYEGHYEQGYLGKGVLVWGEHYKWWKELSNWKHWIIELDDGVTRKRPIGSIWFSCLDKESPEVGLYIGEVSLWNKGAGKAALKKALSWAKEQGYKKVYARIIKDNRKSVGLFESMEFKKVGDAKEGEWMYKLILD